jgi:hypothetical protein
MCKISDVTLSVDQIESVLVSLRSSIRNATEKAELSARKGLHDAQQEQDFYNALMAKYSAIVTHIEAQMPKAETQSDEDVCSDCGEDYGFCQCEEDCE